MSYDSLNPTTKGRPCPKAGKRCPGTVERCAFWRRQEVERDGKAVLIENCLFVLQFELETGARQEHIRTQACIDKVASEIANGSHRTNLALFKVLTGQVVPPGPLRLVTSEAQP